MTDQPQIAAPDGQDDNPKRRQILVGARQMFLSKGFEGTSMQDVAKAAGVSKGTLYVYFDSKEAMFEALVLRECGRLQDTMRRIGSGDGAVEDELFAIARQMVTTLLQPEVLAAMRMMIGAGEKFPDLAHKIYEAGPARSVRTLGEYLRLRETRGDLAVGDCDAAAAQFVDLVFAGLQRRALLMMPPWPEAETEAYLRRRVESFLAICRAGRG
ncbi:TetR/AcrR family transcriptional regulator [Paracoccus laeviglucosivorans]|uniref:Transcriptional regulator, TetR family n=1 Tax=Paracoccus laeviglucosivorans TaxID=1197861 RepID=A0A521ETE1_9RHOB|nr:TetR/AcrR family transcriptional regulator [Paracoccus laeviglucosivorans]SMO87218.1 transcriptional regulator, TetR family [Paracoccus laeviglucosivorans]